MTHFLLIALVAAAQQPQVATTAVKVDSETISGLGARNIGSAAMSGRVAALAAVHEGSRLTVYVGAASGGGGESANGGPTDKPGVDKQPGQALRGDAGDPQKPQRGWGGPREASTRDSA